MTKMFQTTVTVDNLFDMVVVSTILAMIFSLPPLLLFIGLYYAGIHIAIAAVVGFGSHYIILAFADKISTFVTKLFQ